MKLRSVLSSLSFILGVWLLSLPICFAFTPVSELEALLNFHNEAFKTVVWQGVSSGRTWEFVSTDVTAASFNQTNPCGSADDQAWQGVECTEIPSSCRDDSPTVCSINTLDMDSFNLTGTLNSDMDQLSMLTKLILGGNHFSGTIPLSFGNLSDLQVSIHPSCHVMSYHV
jgi:hypothetical protein